MVQINFDATTVDPATGGADVIETGTYKFHITKSEEQTTSKGGKMLVFELTCLEGQFKGKKIQDRLNIQNSSQDAMEIAYRTLSAICHVCGVLKPDVSQRLHGIPFTASVEKTIFTKRDGSEGFSTEVKAYMDVDGNPPKLGQVPSGVKSEKTNPPAPPAHTNPPAQPQPQTTSNEPPWAASNAASGYSGGDGSVPPWQQT